MRHFRCTALRRFIKTFQFSPLPRIMYQKSPKYILRCFLFVYSLKERGGQPFVIRYARRTSVHWGASVLLRLSLLHTSRLLTASERFTWAGLASSLLSWSAGGAEWPWWPEPRWESGRPSPRSWSVTVWRWRVALGTWRKWRCVTSSFHPPRCVWRTLNTCNSSSSHAEIPWRQFF